jgi:periplasmic protein CpxP/Spy
MKLLQRSLIAVLVLGGLMAFSPVSYAAKAARQTKPTTASRANAKDRLTVLTQKLGLTTDQQDKVKSILKEEATKRKEVSGKSDLTVQQKREKLRAIQQDANTQIKALLTPDQLAKWSETQPKATSKANKQSSRKTKRTV